MTTYQYSNTWDIVRGQCPRTITDFLHGAPFSYFRWTPENTQLPQSLSFNLQSSYHCFAPMSLLGNVPKSNPLAVWVVFHWVKSMAEAVRRILIQLLQSSCLLSLYVVKNKCFSTPLPRHCVILIVSYWLYLESFSWGSWLGQSAAFYNLPLIYYNRKSNHLHKCHFTTLDI